MAPEALPAKDEPVRSDASGAPARPAKLRRIAGIVGAVFLGLVFLLAGLAKVVDPAAFAEVVHAEGLDFLLSALVVALLAIAVEVGLGVALTIGLRTRAVLFAASALVVGFLFLTGRAYIAHLRGDAPAVHSCGCFGNLVDRSPTQAFWQDVAMLVPPLLLAWWAGPIRRGDGQRVPKRVSARWIAVVAATVGAVGIGIAAPSLPFDDLATRLHVGDRVKEICTSAGKEPFCLPNVAPHLASGKNVVILANLDDPAFAESIPELNAYAADRKGPRLTVLVSNPKEDAEVFCLMAGATCPILPGAPISLLRPLYRRLPRSFLVVEGRVETIWDGLPPLRSLSSPISR